MKRDSNGALATGRRGFLRNSAFLGIAVAAQVMLPAADGHAFLFGSKKEQKITKSKLVMGTYVSITTIHPSKDQAEEAISLAFLEIERLNSLLSRHIDTTPLSQLNSQGRLEDAPPELVEVVSHSLDFYKSSSGAFDITVLPILELYEQRFGGGVAPTEREIAGRLALVGSQHIRVAGGKITLDRAGMGLTTDGIAKGYVVDRASQILIDNGIENHLINAGGDIRTHGNGARGKSWTIAVQDPAKDRRYPEIISMNTGAVATSGNYEIYFDQAKLFHHIIDPKSGRSPQLSKSVTTIAPTVMEADALSTAVFVLGPSAGVHYINAQPLYAALIVDKDDRVQRSNRWRE